MNVDSIVICEITNRKAKNDIKKCICISIFYITQTLYKDIILTNGLMSVSDMYLHQSDLTLYVFDMTLICSDLPLYMYKFALNMI